MALISKDVHRGYDYESSPALLSGPKDKEMVLGAASTVSRAK